MNCPNDSTPLVMSQRSGIEIDYCQSCRGIWLDRGELDKLIDRESGWDQSQQSTQRNDDYNNHKHYDSQYKHKKQKGFLGDLFDF